jgi:FkbM family methyltransferase
MKRRSFENLIHRKLLSLGWRVQRDTPAPKGWEPARAYWDPLYLRRLGFQPATVIDVGVARGTPELYETFPDAQLLLVEPVEEFFDDISRILSQRPGMHVPVALGSEPCEREIRIETKRPLLTSFYNRHELERTGDAPIIRPVKVDTLDRVVAGTSFPTPFGLKIDAEGSEFDVVLGASETLRHTEFVIAEVSVLPRFEGGYGFSEFISALGARGFEVCDILDIGRADSSHVTFVDLVFKRENASR